MLVVVLSKRGVPKRWSSGAVELMSARSLAGVVSCKID